jgi:hypothetical protein
MMWWAWLAEVALPSLWIRFGRSSGWSDWADKGNSNNRSELAGPDVSNVSTTASQGPRGRTHSGVTSQALDATMICFIMRRLYW